jgi:YggT family protein
VDVGCIIHYLLVVYLVVLASRAILSWFPVRPGSPLAPINSILFDLTEPVLRPVRRVIPPAGMFDLAFLVVFFAIVILEGAVFTC